MGSEGEKMVGQLSKIYILSNPLRILFFYLTLSYSISPKASP